jgi:hypothetical protein
MTKPAKTIGAENAGFGETWFVSGIDLDPCSGPDS